MTYYFTGKAELIREAFTRFADTVAERFEQRMLQASTAEEAERQVIATILDDVFPDERELVLTHELYTLAARAPEYRVLTTAWLSRSRQALQRHFDLETAQLLDALVEGLTIHRALDGAERDRIEVHNAVRRVIGNARQSAS